MSRLPRILTLIMEWWLRRVYQRVPHFGRNDYVTESERLKTQEKHGDYRKFYCFGLWDNQRGV